MAELRSFVAAAEALGLSKPTVSKAVSRLEARLGTQLLHRTSRRFALTEAGRALAERAARMLAEAEGAEGEALDQAAAPRGLIRLAAPMSFGMAYVAPALPVFLAAHPDIAIDLHLSDEAIDLVGGGFDLALRIAALADSSLVARKLCPIERMLVASPDYLERHGRPAHPDDLAAHALLGYAYLPTPDAWRLRSRAGEEAAVRPRGPLRANNADALTHALRAGLGIAIQPRFVVWRDLAEGRLEVLLPDWSLSEINLHLVTPGGGPRPARVSLLLDFLASRFMHADWSRLAG